MQYKAGDHLGVLPRNNINLIRRVMLHFGLDAGSYLTIIPNRGSHTHLPTDEPAPLLGVLGSCVELQDPATRGDIEVMARYTSAPDQRSSLEGLVGTDDGMLAVGHGMVFIYALRGAGMYALTTTSLLREAGIMPKWLALVSYLVAAFLLLSTVMHPAAMLLFPTWVVIAGLVVFIRAGRAADRLYPKGNQYDDVATAWGPSNHAVDG
jgi:FAD binding domain